MGELDNRQLGEPVAGEPVAGEPVGLWDRAVAQTEYALQSGALQPIPTEFELIEQGGITFLVRTLVNLARKAAAQSAPKPNPSVPSAKQFFNPFLPYDPDLFVADLSATHVCLLNKYNVTDYHLLLITRDFEPQESLLTLLDFEALWRCLTEIDGLGFYNSGKLAGASQPHKHLQLVPLPLSATRIPVETALQDAVWQDGVGQSPLLPFQHAVMHLEFSSFQQAVQAAQSAYSRLLQTLSLTNGEPYNLLVTRQWMLMVPRQHEHFEAIPVNALGFAGTLFVRSPAQLEQLKAIGPLTLLKQVAVAI